MPAPKLLARDKRRWYHRKEVAIGLVVVGVPVLGYLGYLAWKRLWVDRTMAPGARTDWSGCEKPPADITNRPAYECGATVSYEGRSQKIESRAWSAAGGAGTWVYGCSIDGNIEESNLSPASEADAVNAAAGPGVHAVLRDVVESTP